MPIRKEVFYVLAAKLYVAAALLISALFSPIPYFLIPVGTLLFYLILELRGGLNSLKLPFYLFLPLSLPLLLQPLIGAPIGPVFSLPAILLFDQQLRKSTHPHPQWGRRFPLTRRCWRLILSLLTVAFAGMALGSLNLLLSSLLMGIYLGSAILITLLKTRKTPVHAEATSYKVLAGELNSANLRLHNVEGLRGQLFLNSPYPWFKVEPTRLTLNEKTIQIKAVFTPPLSGPSLIRLEVSFLDLRGLVERCFSLDVMHLLVIPRARYAEWLARRYLEMSRGGGVGAMTALAQPLARIRRKGVEFYGLRSYQPGDSARDIDWKHAIKLHQLVCKEFLEAGAESAILAVNLSVLGEEEKDKLVYMLIATTLTLACENIPCALAAYNHQEVVKVTRRLDPRQALVQALKLTKDVIFVSATLRYLGLPDISRLRANISRLAQDKSEAASKLAWLLGLEYEALRLASGENPATRAINRALIGVNGRPNILFISTRNHDAEALAFLHFSLKEKGYRVASLI